MPKFSEREGFTKPVLQINSLDQATRNRLYNLIVYDCEINYFIGERNQKALQIWSDFFGQNNSEIVNYEHFLIDFLNKSSWYLIMNCVDFVANNFYQIINTNTYNSKVNRIFEENHVGYRLLNGQVIPITNQDELDEINKVLKTNRKTIGIHIQNAIKLLSHLKAPNYANVIKESILAVEAALQYLTGDTSKTMGELLDLLSKKYHVEQALTKSWKAIYGFASDKWGIRHAAKPNEAVANLDDARYFLITCSAFVNYLLAKYEGK